MEELSFAYAHAIAGAAGFGFDRVRNDYDSIDASISARGKLSPDSIWFSPKVDLQLKATTTGKMGSNGFAFDLPMKNYNDLRLPDRHVAALLVVLRMPPDEARWLTHSEHGLTSRWCAYWCNLRGLPEVANRETRRILIPRTNQFTPATLRELLTIISKGENIGDVL